VPRHGIFAQTLHFAYTIHRLADFRTILSPNPGGAPRQAPRTPGSLARRLAAVTRVRSIACQGTILKVSKTGRQNHG